MNFKIKSLSSLACVLLTYVYNVHSSVVFNRIDTTLWCIYALFSNPSLHNQLRSIGQSPTQFQCMEQGLPYYMYVVDYFNYTERVIESFNQEVDILIHIRSPAHLNITSKYLTIQNNTKQFLSRLKLMFMKSRMTYGPFS